jgi:hypothetical protein
MLTVQRKRELLAHLDQIETESILDPIGACRQLAAIVKELLEHQPPTTHEMAVDEARTR